MHKTERERLFQTPSVWQASLRCQPSALQPLPAQCDIVIVGAGIGGLSAAVHALRNGCTVTVLEAGQLGAGASARNSGFVVPVPSRHSAASLKNVLGDSAATFVRALQRTASVILDFGGAHTTRQGWIQPFPDFALADIRHIAQQWQHLGVDAEYLEREQLIDQIGTAYYHSGVLFRGGGGIDPCALLQQLADTVTALGGQIIEQCPAIESRASPRHVLVQTTQGDIRADYVVLAGNAYGTHASRTTLSPIGRIDLALASFVVEQLPDATARVPFSDARKDMWFCRRITGNRLLTGAFILPGVNAIAHSSQLITRRIKALFGSYPIELEKLWAGRVGLTRHGLPVVTREQQRIIRWSGCNGRGIALSSLMGELLIDHLLGRPTLALPAAGLSSKTLTQWLAHSLIALDRYRNNKARTSHLTSYPSGGPT